MAKEATFQVRMDADLKRQVEQLYKRMGTSFAEAVRIFARQSLQEQALPFVPHLSAQAYLEQADDIRLSNEVIEAVLGDAVPRLQESFGDYIQKIYLYGSCARGDYRADSDIDVAILVSSEREECKKYRKQMAELATELAMEYLAVVNFICLPYKEFEEQKEWYPLYQNIEKEGKCLYSAGLIEEKPRQQEKENADALIHGKDHADVLRAQIFE